MIGPVGCGCLALAIAAIVAVIFFIYASTDPGPPVEGAFALLRLAGILVVYRTLGVPRLARG